MNTYRKSLLAVVVLALIVFLGTLSMAWVTNAKLADARKSLSALQETENQLLLRAKESAALEHLAAQLPEEEIWSQEVSGQAEAALQQTLVQAANDAGLNVISFGATATPSSVKVPAIAYEIEMEGGHRELAQFITTLEAHVPRLAISYLWARQIAGIDDRFNSPVSLQLSVWGFLPSESVLK